MFPFKKSHQGFSKDEAKEPLLSQPTTLEQFKTSLSKYVRGGTPTLITQPPLYALAKRLLGMPSFADMLDEIYRHTLEFCSQKNPSGMPIDPEFASILEASLILRQDQSQQPEDILSYANLLMPCMMLLFVCERTISALSDLMPTFSRQQRKAILIHLEWLTLIGLFKPLHISDDVIQAIKQLKREWNPAWLADPQVLINGLRQQLDVQAKDTRTRFNAVSSLAFVSFKTPPTPIQAGEVIDILVKQFHTEQTLSEVEAKKIEETQAKQISVDRNFLDLQRTHIKLCETVINEHHLVMRKLLSTLVDLPFAIPSSHEQIVVDMMIAGLSHSHTAFSLQAWGVLKDVPFASLPSQKKRLLDRGLALINKDIDRDKRITSQVAANLILLYPLLTDEDPQKEAIFNRLMSIYSGYPPYFYYNKTDAFAVLSSIFPYLPTPLKKKYVQKVIEFFEQRTFKKFPHQISTTVVSALMITNDHETISLPDQAKLVRSYLDFCYTHTSHAAQTTQVVLKLLKSLPLFSKTDVCSIASYIFSNLTSGSERKISYTVSLLPQIYTALPSVAENETGETKAEDGADRVEKGLSINSQLEMRRAILRLVSGYENFVAQKALVGIAATMNQQQFTVLVDELEQLSVHVCLPLSQIGAQTNIRKTIYALYEAQREFVSSQQAEDKVGFILPQLHDAIRIKLELEGSIKQLNERLSKRENKVQDGEVVNEGEAEGSERLNLEQLRLENDERLTTYRRLIKWIIETLISLLAKVSPDKQDAIMLEIVESVSGPDKEIALYVLSTIIEKPFYFPQPQRTRLVNALLIQLQTSMPSAARVVITNALARIFYEVELKVQEACYTILMKELQDVTQIEVWQSAAKGLVCFAHNMTESQEKAYVAQLLKSLTMQNPVDEHVEFVVVRIMIVYFPHHLATPDLGKFFVKLSDRNKWAFDFITFEALVFLENLISYLETIPKDDLVTLAQNSLEILKFMADVPSEDTAKVHDLFPKMFAALPNENKNGAALAPLPPKLMLCEHLIKALSHESASARTRQAAYDALAKIAAQVDVTWQNKLKELLCSHFVGTECSEVRLNLFKLLGVIYSEQQTQACLTEFIAKDVAHTVTGYMFSSH